MDISELPPDSREALLRGAWYAHDARWFAAATAEYGIEAANRLNRAAVRALARVEASRLARALDAGPSASVDAALDLLRAGLDLYIGPTLMDMDLRRVDDSSYEVTVNDCFIARNIQKAGIADTYECAVWDRVQGYHEALGQSLADGQLAAVPCARARGQECRRILRTA